jgi:hypothetical protein
MNSTYKPVFTEEQYNSPDGMSTLCWGPWAWSFLHCTSCNFPPNPSEQDKDHYHDFLMSLKYVLPCKACRDNYAKNLEDLGYSRACLESRKTFSMFIYRLHNQVNKMLGKECPLTFNQVRDRYEMFRARCINETPIIPRGTTERKEHGCETPLTGIKSKSVISIVPIDTKSDVFKIDPKCIPKRIGVLKTKKQKK